MDRILFADYNYFRVRVPTAIIQEIDPLYSKPKCQTSSLALRSALCALHADQSELYST